MFPSYLSGSLLRLVYYDSNLNRSLKKYVMLNHDKFLFYKTPILKLAIGVW